MPELRGKHLHIDGAAGAAGDMFLGALLDLGVPRDLFDDAFDRIGLGRDRLQVSPVLKGGLRAIDVNIDVHDEAHGDLNDRGHGRGHGHELGHAHAHVPYRDIVQRLNGAGLEQAVLERALDIFARIARAEAALHGTSIDDVEFHEVGSIDSIADVVAAAVGLTFLAPAVVTASPVALGHGAVRTAHGLLPIPAPAALEILREAGAAVEDGGAARELCTPTGAAILAHAVGDWTAMPKLVPLAIGHGAGDADLPDRPNVLRLVVGQPLPSPDRTHRTVSDDLASDAGTDLSAADSLYRVEANIDDMSPEVCEHAADAMVAAGALDVWWTPIAMKKSRPALLLSALAPTAALDGVLRAALTETTSIGVRFDRVARRVLAREKVEVETRFGRIPVKVARMDGRAVNAAPEYEACRAAARAHGAPLKEVFAAALAAWERAAGH